MLKAAKNNDMIFRNHIMWMSNLCTTRRQLDHNNWKKNGIQICLHYGNNLHYNQIFACQLWFQQWTGFLQPRWFPVCVKHGNFRGCAMTFFRLHCENCGAVPAGEKWHGILRLPVQLMNMRNIGLFIMYPISALIEPSSFSLYPSWYNLVTGVLHLVGQRCGIQTAPSLASVGGVCNALPLMVGMNKRSMFF